jgi:hypothetical protein
MEPFTKPEVDNLDKREREGLSIKDLIDPVASDTGLSEGINFTATLDFNLQQVPMLTSGPSANSQSAPNPLLPAQPPRDPQAPPGIQPVWYTVNKTLGPLSLQRVGAMYDKNTKYAWFMLDCGLNTAILSVGLEGLGIGLDITAPTDLSKIRPTLTGLSIDFQSGPVEISGSMRKSGDEYSGSALIKIEEISLAAFGSYRRLPDGQSSVFLYAVLNDPPLGGPAFFFVTGLAAGFGYNRGFTLPTLDNVTEFPLVKAATGGGNDVQLLHTMVEDFPAQTGSYWLAAGIKFTSFNQMESFALLTAEFGTRLRFALIGRSTISVPASVEGATSGDADSKIKPLAYAEIVVIASYTPADGVFKIEGKLTSASYLLVPECTLMGGFAFYLWSDGDFVLTFGGYHPHFDRGSRYPLVDPLGLSFKVGSNLQITAKAYFALTPSAIMAGGRLDALW